MIKRRVEFDRTISKNLKNFIPKVKIRLENIKINEQYLGNVDKINLATYQNWRSSFTRTISTNIAKFRDGDTLEISYPLIFEAYTRAKVYNEDVEVYNVTRDINIKLGLYNLSVLFYILDSFTLVEGDE